MNNEQDILLLPKNRNYHYEFKTMGNEETCVLHYKLSDKLWIRHCEYCEEKGFDNNIKQWVEIFIDKEDFNKVKEYGMSVYFNHLYNTTNVMPYIKISLQRSIDKIRSNYLIHRFILDSPKDMQVDHINHDTFDNRRNNLRIVTCAENNQNRNSNYYNSKTGIRGVSIVFDKRWNCKYYVAQVQKNNKRVFCKQFPFTQQGLINAEQAVIEARQLHFAHSEMHNNEVNNND